MPEPSKPARCDGPGAQCEVPSASSCDFSESPAAPPPLATPPPPPTIVAIATPPGAGAIGIVRLSGAAVGTIARALLGSLPPPRHAVLRTVCDDQGRTLDRVLVLYFPAPHSYTGEDVLELHAHGGPVLLDLIMERVLALGAQVARAGEFSERAFLNGKMDLAQAEAVADLISSASRSAALGAARSLQGAFSERVQALAAELLALRALLEAHLDFPEEDDAPVETTVVPARLSAVLRDVKQLLTVAQRGQLLRDGLHVVLAGAPNAGKSSLLNALAQQPRAIVHAAAGTTRDVLEAHIEISGVPLTLVDTAGLRDVPDDAHGHVRVHGHVHGHSDIENEGIRRAHAAMERADGILLVHDDADRAAPTVAAMRAQLPAATPLLVVHNKIDQSRRAPGWVRGVAHHASNSDADKVESAGDSPPLEVAVSAQQGTGLAVLREALKCALGLHGAMPSLRHGNRATGGTTHDRGRSGGDEQGGVFSARRRHLQALQQSRHHIQTATNALAQDATSLELAAEDLRLAHRALGEITGACTSEDVLGQVFSTFCIGK